LPDESGVLNGSKITTDADIYRLALNKRCGNRMVNELLGIIQVIHNNLSACDSLEAAILLAEVGHPDSMMQNAVGPIVVRIRAPDDTDDGQILSVSPHYRIDDAEPPNCERDDAGPHAPGSRVPIGRVAGVELVAAADEIEARLRQQMVQQGQIEVPRNRENIADANLNEPPRQVAAQRGGGKQRGQSFRH
jgi:hypothetical protein